MAQLHPNARAAVVGRQEHRFVVEQDGAVAELVYEVDGHRLVLVHTGVPDVLGGRGVGSALVEAAVEWGAASNLTVVPSCPFARKWLEDHPDAASAVAIDWDSERPR
ncbi:MAG: GNAT family N-acetyltransferase [Acidimicrobiales bacterium]|jgi:predicted GNAT family acetyltransferase